MFILLQLPAVVVVVVVVVVFVVVVVIVVVIVVIIIVVVVECFVVRFLVCCFGVLLVMEESRDVSVPWRGGRPLTGCRPGPGVRGPAKLPR